MYEQGNYDLFRQKVSDFEWTIIHDNDVNLYARTFTDNLLNIAEECIPTKNVTIRPCDLPWLNNNIRKLMRQRNRLYKR